jgi:hypothetical protein
MKFTAPSFKSCLTGSLAATLLAASPLWAGIAMRFVDITLENVPPGAAFSIRSLKNLPLVLVNQDDRPEGIDIGIEIDVPDKNEMKEGYEPIPDPSWIRVTPNSYHLGPKASASSDVLVNIPNDPALIGKHYEAIIFAHTMHKNMAFQGSGVVIETGLRSRIRISIGTAGPAALQREKDLKKLATINTNFSISPDNVYVQGVEVGKTLDLKSDKKASLKVINESDEAVELKFAPVPPDPNVVPQAGYEYAPDPTWLEVITKKLKVDGNSIKEIRFKLSVPDKPEYRNKKFMFLVQTTLANEELPLALNNMVYVTTNP